MGAAAASQAQGLLGLQQQNAMQALQNKFNAAGLLTNQAQIYSAPQSVAGSGATSALQSYINARNTGIMQTLAGGFAQGLGSGLATGVTGGLGNLMSNIGRGTNIAQGLGDVSSYGTAASGMGTGFMGSLASTPAVGGYG
jgi:hypothetical protein